MKTTTANGRVTVEQTPVIIPDLTVKDLLSAIPYVLIVLPVDTAFSKRVRYFAASTASSGRR